MKKVLVAEDDRDVKRIYHLLLDSDYELINAYNGQEAIDCYKDSRPDLVLMDIQMPVKTGLEAIEEILEYDPAARIVALTAYNYEKAELGVPVYKKGLRRHELIEIIQQNLELSRSLKA